MQGRTVRRADRYDDSFIFERKPFTWPGNKTLAVWIVPNVEVWRYDSASGQAITPNDRGVVPDVVNYAWREYGATPAELAAFEKRMEKQISAERKRGKTKRFCGNLEKDLAG